MSIEPVRANRLQEHEAAIERSLSELGWHLRSIRDEQLYLETHKTFEMYCRERWDYSRSYVHRQIEAAATLDVLPIGNTDVRESQVRPLTVLPLEERAEAWTETVERTGSDSPTAKEVAEVVRERRTPRAVPKPVVAPGIPPHPATYPREVLAMFAGMLDEYAEPPVVIVDPFAGVGKIHELASWGTTIGVELEPEWARAHPDTIVGDSRKLVELLGRGRADVVITSPAYGNRLADGFYNAADPHARRSYPLDLGRPLSDGSGAAIPFTHEPDDDYKILHALVWAEVAEVLKPDGLLLLNVKDFVAAGDVMMVAAWHIHELRRHGFNVIDLVTLPVGGLAMTTASKFSELIIAMRRDLP